MKIYKHEKTDGIAEQVRKSTSLAYVTQLKPLDRDSENGKKIINKVTASQNVNSETLYPMQDILVSTGWNLNLDVFDNGETWIARNSSIHHPLNLEHNEKNIIGNITTSQAVDDSMTAIADDTAIDELPAKFHILNGSVIYRVWSDDEQQKFIDQTIEEIERGEWYVSMECVFKNFDYGIINPEGKKYIVARDENSSFLTKHLRQYGGNGTYKDEASGKEFAIGRVLKNISFSGKGLVRKPANPESIILSHVSAFVSSPADLGYIKTEAENIPKPSVEQTESENMSEVNLENKDLQEKVNQLLKQNEALANQLKEKDNNDAKATIDGLKEDVKQRDGKISNLETTVSTLNETVEALNKRVEATEQSKNELETKLNKIVAEKVAQERYNTLIGKGATAEKAKELVDKFVNFSDEDFNFIVDTASAAWKKSEKRNPQDVINDVVVEKEASMASADTEEDSLVGRAKAAEFIGGFLKHKYVNPAKPTE